MNKQRANIRSNMTRLIASFCGFAVIGFSVTASAVPPPPPPPPPSAPLGDAPSPPPIATAPSAFPPAPLAPPPPPPAPERPMPSPVNAPQQNPNNGAWDNAASPPPLSWRPTDASLPPMWPARIEYEDGDVVLPGYNIKTRAQQGLLVGGLTTFLVPYSISFLIGGIFTLNGNSSTQSEFAPLLIPVFGPFVALGQWESTNESGAFIMLANGFTQAAGAAMVISGILMPDKYLERMATFPGKPEVFVGARTTTLRLHF